MFFKKRNKPYERALNIALFVIVTENGESDELSTLMNARYPSFASLESVIIEYPAWCMSFAASTFLETDESSTF